MSRLGDRSRARASLAPTFGLGNPQIEAAFAKFFDEERPRDGKFDRDGARRRLTASDQPGHDGGMPAGGAFHGCETRGFVIVVEQVDGGDRKSVV